jgi:hypothetical protein
MKVLYIGGTGRTGSTLLQTILGQDPTVFDLGEMTWFWWALERGGRCSCGELLDECPIWSTAMDRAFGAGEPFAPDEMVALRRRFDSRYLPLMAVPGMSARLARRLGPFGDRTQRLYREVADLTGSRLLVDSSKEPHYSWILRQQPGLDVHFLHLVRDPRAIAHSWQRVRQERGFGGAATMARRGTVVSATYHDVSNLASELLWRDQPSRYLFLRYEDFVAEPAAAIERIEAFVGMDLALGGVLDGDVVDLAPTHSAWGNPNRFDRGRIDIRADDAWRHHGSPLRHGLTAALTYPFMRRYGYAGSDDQP